MKGVDLLAILRAKLCVDSKELEAYNWKEHKNGADKPQLGPKAA